MERNEELYGRCVERAARLWCLPTTSDLEMKVALAEAFAVELYNALAMMERLKGELQWCSGASIFSPEGEAHEGWIKGPQKAIRDADAFMREANYALV